ncbi:ABC transporter substrate-binding protein [Streptomyces sp. BK239]|uniref:ABC transporter substrate-binding protein n=1 Tax=Streptomyces sp. BK239 TaxID=2512155 RepID=UPI00102D1C5A|nr:ABC transporter substrate-binding protein [Streptomyces sp. BK239]RZU17219.1 ABC-type glycerol-3-phosphate transport system substrate-binding protein [Streptomyces sp. BK239]
MGRKALTVAALIAVTAVTATGCTGAAAPKGESAAAASDPGSVSGAITVLTHRTDLVQNGTLKKYAAEFNKVYPEVTVKFDALTDYEGEVKIRMNTANYGDVLMIPNAIAKKDYPSFFASLGSATELSRKYRFTDKANVDGKVYGLATVGNSDGFVYNKAVWKKAGITSWPTSPEQFLAGLRAVKAKTGAVPYYTNFKDQWPVTAGTASIGSVTCDAQANDKLATSTAPWAAGGDLNVIDTLLYDVVHEKLIEKDPTTTNWENSKGMIARGEIATMQLGSWAISQMQNAARTAGTNPDDIGFMPFPAQTNGKFCSMLSSDYQDAVSIHSKNKPAARAWVDWFTDKSGFAQNEGSIPTLRSGALPATLKPFQDNGVSMLERSEARSSQVNAIDNAAEIGLAKPDYRQKLVDMARGVQGGSLKDYFAGLDEKWSRAAKSAGS